MKTMMTREIPHPIVISKEISQTTNYGALSPLAKNTVQIASNELGQLFAIDQHQPQSIESKPHWDKYDPYELDMVHDALLERLKHKTDERFYKSVHIVKEIIHIAGTINTTIATKTGHKLRAPSNINHFTS